MAAPDRIENGDTPDATVLMAWLDYLTPGVGAGGGPIKDTYDNLRAMALLAPTASFLCIATDQGAGGQLYCYMGNALAGDGGFVLIGG